MDPDNTVVEEVADGEEWVELGDNTIHVRHYLAGVCSTHHFVTT